MSWRGSKHPKHFMATLGDVAALPGQSRPESCCMLAIGLEAIALYTFARRTWMRRTGYEESLGPGFTERLVRLCFDRLQVRNGPKAAVNSQAANDAMRDCLSRIESRCLVRAQARGKNAFKSHGVEPMGRDPKYAMWLVHIWQSWGS